MPERETSVPAWRVVMVFGITLVLLALIIVEIAKPLRVQLAERFLVRGDTYFTSLQFDEALREYDKALQYQPDQPVAKAHKDLATVASADIRVARGFFEEHGILAVTNKIDAATQLFDTPKEALTKGVELYAAGDFRYARYPLERAVELDPNYPEAWHYLSLTYDELAKERAEYREKAEAARAKRDALTPKYLMDDGAGVQ